MGKYENDYLQVMANQDKWQAYELEDISEQKKLEKHKNIKTGNKKLKVLIEKLKLMQIIQRN